MQEPGTNKSGIGNTTGDYSGQSPNLGTDISAVSYRLSDLESHRRKLFQSEREHKAYTGAEVSQKNIDHEYVTFRREGYVTLGRNPGEGPLACNSSLIPGSGMTSDDWNRQKGLKEEAQFETFNEGKSLQQYDEELPRPRVTKEYLDEPVARRRGTSGSREPKPLSSSLNYSPVPNHQNASAVSKSQANPFFTEDQGNRYPAQPTSMQRQGGESSQTRAGQTPPIPKQGYLSRGMMMMRNRRTDSKSRGPTGSRTPGKTTDSKREQFVAHDTVNVFDQIKKQAVQTVQNRLHFPN